MSLPTGTRLGPYEVLARIGAGGMGEVYRAHDPRLGRDVALKILPAEVAQDSARRKRFEQEARMVAALSHPNILSIHDVGNENDVSYIVTELVDGETLRGVRVTAARAVDITAQIAEGLAAAHAAGVIHRDLKPDNVMVTRDGRVKILDFGLARVSGAVAKDDATEIQTQTGLIIGTVGYMSPEQVRGSAVDHRSDLFNCGLLLYELLAGKRAFQGESALDVLNAIVRDDPPALSDTLPREVRHLVNRCLEKKPENRFQSARDLAFALREQLTGTPTGASRAADRRSLAFGWTVWMMAGAVAVAVVVGAVLASRWPRQPLISGGKAATAVAGSETLPVQPTNAPSEAKDPRVQTPDAAELRSAAAPRLLTDTDVLVLADFTNRTGDSVFDVTLREALAFELEQSRFLKVMGDERVRQTLGLMGRSPDTRMTNQVAREICVRAGEKAFISGSIANLGKTYAIALQAANCQTGDPLAREQASAGDKEHVLEAIAGAARGMRAKLGESLGSIQKPDRNLTQVTTTSLAAFQAYALGLAPVRQGQWLAAIPFFQRATELDPDFALAWLRLGQMHGNSGDNASMRKYYEKAFALRDRVTERERLAITATYYGVNEPSKAAEIYRAWIRTYPRDAYPHFRLGQDSLRKRRYEEALPEYLEAVRLEPRAIYYSELMDAYVALGRLGDAKALAEKGFALNLDSPDAHLNLLRIAHIQGDKAAAEREIQWFANKPEEYSCVLEQAQDAYSRGERRKSLQLWQRALDLRRQQNLAATVARQPPARDPTLGECDESSPIARAYCGDAAAAQRLVDQFAGVENPSAQMLYLRGLAYLGQRKGGEAAMEFQKLLDHKAANWGLFYHLSFIGLARAAALAGNVVEAKKAYRDFFEVWKDADVDIPVLIAARNEYAALN